MADRQNRQEALARFFMQHRLKKEELRTGHRVVVFVIQGDIAEIQAQGIFFGFKRESLGECIILGNVPDEETENTFPEPLAHIQRMNLPATFLLPRHMFERRSEEPERRSVLLRPGFMFADGDLYAQLNAMQNIPRPKAD